ncbi:DEAD/DEAH box helicase [Mucilaginibacter sp. SJ]|uniref:DEAD/DEAH box helicase n=1 Tax=Mucilaginibacter sp. SJ TaxID=3029053 RepID=UPI0023A9D4F5|nr:DEAD/DEAH box helicase [Mucilaginibacter sp. SJ]WEA01703.1 DEAD/DEAH box helicase [Mucilaginibacter sp. SJ]
MNVEETKEVLNQLLDIDLRSNAAKFKFIPSFEYSLTKDFIAECIQVVDTLSYTMTEEADRHLVTISALLWTYAKDKWLGLEDYLILFLTRRGFAPTATMLDETYIQSQEKFKSQRSLFNQFAVTLNQVKFQIRVAERSFLITSFQKEVWDAVNNNRMVGVSAPTSAGKSYIILIKMMELLLERIGPVIYIVPTLSLVAQVATDIKRQLSSFNIDCQVETSYNHQQHAPNLVYVLTQEKALAAFSTTERSFESLRLLVVDEIQNVERVAESRDQRAKILFDLMIDMKNTLEIDKIILSGPRVTNIDVLGKDIFGIDGYKASTRNSPVVNLTYSLKKINSHEFRFKQYCDLNAEAKSLKIENQQTLQGYGQTMYTAKYLGYFGAFMSCFSQDESNIIFSPTAGASRKMAEELRVASDNRNDDYLVQLSKYLAETVHEDFSLSDTVLSGIAYHNGKLPHHVRNAIEDGIKKRYIRNIVCTTTLLQGVNLPVQNIVIRNPNLFERSQNGERPQLTSYEAANLRGRAGRLLKDFIGRTYVLDEDSFTDITDRQTSMFENTEKNITTGYKDVFQNYQQNIVGDLNQNTGQTSANVQYAYLLTYVRQTVLRHGENASNRMREVGISLPDNVLSSVIAEMNDLEVSKEICLANRYWDPLDLNKLSQVSTEWDLPTSASDSSIAVKLKNILLNLKENFPVYYNRLFGIQENENFDPLMTACRNAESWLKGHSLKRILSGNYFDNNDKIERTIVLLQNKISFDLPMLLKPLYDIRVPNHMFLRFLETGAYQPMIRRLIEMNIPRETAISLAQNYDLGDSDNISSIKRNLDEIYNGLPYFDRLQLQLL